MVEVVRKIVINFSRTATASIFWVLNRLHFEPTLKELLDIVQLKNQVKAGFFWSEAQIL